MTLTRTIRRREQRKAAKKRRANPRPSPFIAPHWLVRERLNQVAEDLKVMEMVKRRY